MTLPNYYSSIAQLVEQRTVNPCVGGSSPPWGANILVTKLEPKNIIRQNFIPDDTGNKKALVLAERYSDIYPNISVNAIPLYGTSIQYDTEVTKLEAPLDPEHFIDIKTIMIRNDIIVNLVDNESFKRKLDFELLSCSPLLYFNAGNELFNGQAYVSFPGHSNFYTIDHPEFLSDVEEVSVFSCADADAEGTQSNPEQMFNANDVAASALANLFQVAITSVVTHRKHRFTTGNSFSVNKELQSYNSLLYAAVSLGRGRDHPYEQAKEFLDSESDTSSPEYEQNLQLVSAIDTVVAIQDIIVEHSLTKPFVAE